MIHSMPCKNLCRLYIHLAFTYSIGPSSVVCSEFGPAPLLPPMRVLKVQWSRALNLVCEVALRITRILIDYARKLPRTWPRYLGQTPMRRGLMRRRISANVQRLKSSMPFKRILALQNIPLFKQPFKTQPQIGNEDVT